MDHGTDKTFDYRDGEIKVTDASSRLKISLQNGNYAILRSFFDITIRLCM